MADLKDREFLGTQPVGHLIFSLSIPTIVAQVVNMLYNMVDRIYIGHIPVTGRLALTGLGVCTPIILLVTAFTSLISSGGAPRASIAMGEGNNTKAEQILGNCFGLQLIISAVLTTVILVFGRQLLMLFGASENTVGYGLSYLRIYALGTVFVQLTLGMNAFITAQGFTKLSMLTVLIGAGLNIVLDPLFIYVFHLGVSGAALATIISQCVSCCWVLSIITRGASFIKLKRQNIRLKKEIFLPCMALGLAPFIMQSTESALSMSFNSSLLKYGGDIAVGAMTILSSVYQLAVLPISGLTQGSQPVISYNYGAKNAQRVRKAVKILKTACFCYACVVWALVVCFPKMFVGIFTSDPELMDFASWALRIYCFCLWTLGLQMSCQMSLVATGKALSSVTIALFRKIVLLIPLIFILPHFVDDPVFGVYLAEPVSDVVAMIFTVTLTYFQYKKIMAQLENPSIGENNGNKT